MNSIQKNSPQAKFNTLQDLLVRNQQSIEAVLPKHMSAERMIRVVLGAATRTPDLLECTPISVVRSVKQAAELGLDCGGTLGSAYLVPYKDNKTKTRVCTLIIGYRGYIELAAEGGITVECRPVFECDHFELEYGLTPKLVHRPSLVESPRDDHLVGCYCVARHADKPDQIEWMPRADIDKIRDRGHTKSYGPWVTDYIEMARKTVVRRAAKYWSIGAKLASAIATDDQTSGAGDPAPPIVMEEPAAPELPATATSSLKDKLKRTNSAPAAQPAPAETPESGSKTEPAPETSPEGGTEPESAPAGAGDLAAEALVSDRMEVLAQLVVRDTKCDEETAHQTVVEWLRRRKKKPEKLVDSRHWNVTRVSAQGANWVALVKELADARNPATSQ